MDKHSKEAHPQDVARPVHQTLGQVGLLQLLPPPASSARLTAGTADAAWMYSTASVRLCSLHWTFEKSSFKSIDHLRDIESPLYNCHVQMRKCQCDGKQQALRVVRMHQMLSADQSVSQLVSPSVTVTQSNVERAKLRNHQKLGSWYKYPAV